MLGLWVGLAAGAAAGEVVDLDQGDEPLASAIDGTTFDVAAAEAGENGVIPLVLVRGQNFVRPISGLIWLADDDGSRPAASRLGAEVGRRWYTLGPARVPWAAELYGGASAPLLGAKGVRLSAGGRLAPRFGPLSVAAGPDLRWDRTTWTKDGSDLATTTVLGPSLDLSVALGPLQPWVGVSPGWQLGGDRDAADARTSTLPVIGDETAYRAGLGIQLKRSLYLPSVTWRETAGGAEVEFLFAMKFAPKRRQEVRP